MLHLKHQDEERDTIRLSVEMPAAAYDVFGRLVEKIDEVSDVETLFTMLFVNLLAEMAKRLRDADAETQKRELFALLHQIEVELKVVEHSSITRTLFETLLDRADRLDLIRTLVKDFDLSNPADAEKARAYLRDAELPEYLIYTLRPTLTSDAAVAWAEQRAKELHDDRLVR